MRLNLGIALVQVLIISLVLATLGLFVSQTVHEQVKLAQKIKSSQELALALSSAEAELIQSLLTLRKYQAKDSSKLDNRWNFYGKAFKFDDVVSIRIQDLDGLLALNMMSRRLAHRALILLEQDEYDIRVFIDSLNDWIDADDLSRLNGAESDYYRINNFPQPRNGYLQSLSEVLSVKKGNILPLKKWREYFTHHYVTGFNPLNAPDLLLRALIEDDGMYNDVVAARNSGQLNELKFFQITGIDGDEYFSFATGQKFRVELSANADNVNIKKSFVVEADAFDSNGPVIITDVVWNR